ncbi:MAG TPA: MATE family efflux transporter, partial [Bacteroidales bacterium]|nr:MATE family efflux transporter [Bacteroidales bacterium]
ALIVGSLGVIFAQKIFLLIGLPDELLVQATIYLRIYLSGILVFFGFSGTSAVLRGMGDSRTPLYFLIGSTLFNIGLDLLFILGLGMGIGGAALATLISQGSAFITMIIYLNKRHEIIRFRLKGLVFDKDLFRKSLRIGLPTGLQQTFVALGMMALLGIVNTFGTNVVAAYSVATRIDSIAMLPAMIFGQALATFVGQNLGANKSHRVRSGLLSTFGMSSVVSIIVSLVVISLRHFLMGLFTDDQQVIAIGAKYLTIVSAFYLLMSALFTISGVMRGAGDTLIPMFISLFSLWIIRVPVAYFLSSKIGETGIWWAVPVAWTVGVIASFFYYRTGRWKSKVVVKHNSL